jgi:hypothetical protein
MTFPDQPSFRRLLLGMCAGVLAWASLPATALTQEAVPYAPTLGFGAGLVRTPVAWVSPRMGDVLAHGSLSSMSGDGDSWNGNVALETNWARRASLGLSIYSNGPEWGLFGSALLLEEGRAGALPAIAVGFRNLGPYRSLDRLQVSYAGIGTSGDRPLPYAQDFRTAPTLYAVATKSGRIGRVESSFSLGFGNGLFREDGGLGNAYNKSGTLVDGLFLGARAVLWSGETSSFAVMVENDAWDWNAGVAGSWRGVVAGVSVTEIEEGSRSISGSDPLRHYNSTKLNFTIGYRTNLLDVVSGTRLRSRVSALETERQELRAEILKREDRIRRLEDQLRATQAGELGEVLQRRQQLEERIDEEREAIRRAEERLRQLEAERVPRDGSRPN